MISIKEGPGNNAVFIKLGDMPGIVKHNIRLSLFQIGRSNVRHARNLLRLQKTGVKYPSLPNRSSAPGESPASQTGRLSRNIDFLVRGSSQLEFGDKSQGGRAPIGLFLELGTKKMKPRPHIGITVRNEYKNTQSSLIRYAERGMKK